MARNNGPLNIRMKLSAEIAGKLKRIARKQERSARWTFEKLAIAAINEMAATFSKP